MLIFLLPFVRAESYKINGIVLDSLDNLVSEAEVKADCVESQTFKTDKFGSFTIKDSPKGSCRIYAAFKDGIGFKDIMVSGQLDGLEIKLDKTIVRLSRYNGCLSCFLFVDKIPAAALAASCIILFLTGFLLVLRFAKKKKRKEKKVNEIKETKSFTPHRIADILQTLAPKEKRIVEFLLENNSQSSQAQIRHNTGIARTSLARCLKTLEAKKIVSVEKLGKMVRVRLTTWFLEK